MLKNMWRKLIFKLHMFKLRKKHHNHHGFSTGFDKNAAASSCNAHSHHHHHHHCHHHSHHHSREEFLRIKEQPGIIPLSNAELRDYIFIYAYCPDEHFEHKLLEMGFVPGSSLKVLEKTNVGHKSSVLVKIKGSTLALNMQIAENILISPQQ